MLPKNHEMTADQKKNLMTVATKIAREVGYPNAKRLYKFAKNWFEYDGKKLWNDEYYFTEWAERMRDGKDYIKADCFNTLSLMDVDGGKETYIQTYMDYHWVNRAEATQAVNKSIAHCKAEMAKHMPKLQSHRMHRKSKVEKTPIVNYRAMTGNTKKFGTQMRKNFEKLI